MLIYFVLLITLYTLGLSKLKYKNQFMFLILFLFSALRFDVGYDFAAYYDIIDYKDEYNYERMGFINQILIDISRNFNFYQFYYIITSFLITYLTSKTISEFSNNYFFSILLFVTIPIFYLMSFSIIRQATAMAIVFYSLKYIINKNFLKYIILTAIASFVHVSALVAIPIYFLYGVKFSKIFAVGLVLSSTLVATLFVTLIELYIPLYSSYVHDLAKHGKGILYFFLLIFIFILMNYKYIKDINTSFFFNTFTVGVFLYSATIQFGEVAPRVSYFYLIFSILLIPSILKFYKKKQMYFVFLLVMSFLYGVDFYMFSKIEAKNPYIPYNIFLFIDEKSYNWK